MKVPLNLSNDPYTPKTSKITKNNPKPLKLPKIP